MKTVISTIFGKNKVNTVDSVLQTFTKTIDALKEVEAQQDAVAYRYEYDLAEAEALHKSKVKVSQKVIDDAYAESARATLAVTRFSKLVEGI